MNKNWSKIGQTRTSRYFLSIGLGTIQILRNPKGGWVRPNTYVCLQGGWVGVAKCLRNHKNHPIS